MIEDLNDTLELLRHKNDRLLWFEAELEKQLADTADEKNVERGVIDENSPASLINCLDVVDGGRTDASQTDSSDKGEAIDKPPLKSNPVLSDVEEVESED